MDRRRRTGDDDTRVTVAVALAANVLIAAAKIAAGVASGSAVMLAEAGHSVADAADQAILAMSLRLGRRPPDAEHQFGHGKERFFWSFFAAVMIFVTGAAFAVGEGVLELVRGADGGGSPVVGYAVLAFALAAEGASVARALADLRRGAARSGTGLARFVRETRNPTPRVVMFEDSAAIVGIALAFAGLGLRQLTGSSVYDAVASILVGVLLAGVAVAVGVHARSLLLGESARPDVRRALERAAARHDGVESVAGLRTMHVGPDEMLVVAQVELRDDLRVPDIERLAREVREDLRRVEPAVAFVYLHPAEPAPGRPSPVAGSHGDGGRDM